MDDIKRALEFDPLAEVERVYGNKHWSEFNEDQMGVAMGLAFLHNENKDELLKRANDTHSSMDWNEFENILFANGFKIGYEEKFPYEDHEEKAVAFYREDGLIIWATSFYNMKSVNGGNLYGEIKLNSIEDRRNIPSCSNGFYDFDNLKLYFDKDIREGLIWFIKNMKSHGELISEWEEKNKFLWFLNFIEDTQPDYDYEKISMIKMKQFSDGAKKIVCNLIRE